MNYNMYIDGEWVEASTMATFSVLNPATGKTIGEVPDCGVGDVTRALEAAKKAQPAWAALGPSQRAEYLFEAVNVFTRKQDEFVKMLIEESGSTYGKAMFEASLIPGALREAAALVKQDIGELLPSDVPGKMNMAMRQPAGVVSVISPWNFPLILSLRGFIYAIALGNTAVIKPSEDTPITGGILLAKLFEEVELPKGVINIVTCSRAQAQKIGGELIRSPLVDRVNFTGSTNVGRQIAVECAKNLKKGMFEMGGKNPLLILKDAEIDYAVDVAFFSAFLHQGQICMSADKIIVDSAIIEAFTEKFVEKVSMFKPTEPTNQMSVIGPMINERQLSKVDDLVKTAIEQGAKVECGGRSDGPYYLPTVLSKITREMDIYHKEIFGPVALIVTASDEDEAVNIANDTEYGLTAGIISSNAVHALDLARRIEAGMVHINDTTVHDEPHCPFGGTKSSGWYGKWGAKGAIDAFTEQKWVSLQTSPRQFPF